jgi:hypothetical protein
MGDHTIGSKEKYSDIHGSAEAGKRAGRPEDE